MKSAALFIEDGFKTVLYEKDFGVVVCSLCNPSLVCIFISYHETKLFIKVKKLFGYYC